MYDGRADGRPGGLQGGQLYAPLQQAAAPQVPVDSSLLDPSIVFLRSALS